MIILNSKHTSTALQRLQVSLVFDIEGAHDVLESFSSSLTVSLLFLCLLLFADQYHLQVESSSETRIRILVIDPITPLLGPMLSAVSSQGHAIMTTFMRQLRALAQAFELSIFVSAKFHYC